MLHPSLETTHNGSHVSPPKTCASDWFGVLKRHTHAGCWAFDIASQQLSASAGLMALLALNPAPHHAA